MRLFTRWLLLLVLPVLLAGTFMLTSPVLADDTPTPTETPTYTPTPTSTSTPTPTGTWSTLTPTATSTPTPPAVFTWADSEIEPEEAITDALEDLLTGDPPGGTTTLWALTDAAASNDGWYYSLANLQGVPDPYDVWNVLDHGVWLGSAECIEDVTWNCEYYVAALPEGGGAGLMFPWKGGTSAVYGTNGVHAGGWGLQYAVDFFPTNNETYAAEAGTVTWTCFGTYNAGVVVTGTSGDLLYLHLDPDTPLQVGDEYRQGDMIGSLVRGSFSDDCGWANQASSNAHVHFGFDSGDNYYSIGGCVLDIAAEVFNCNGALIGTLEILLNDGDSSSDDPVDPGDGTPVDPGDIVQIWDSIVAAVVDLFYSFEEYLPAHDQRIDFVIDQVRIVILIVMAFTSDVILGPTSATTRIMIITLSTVIGMEFSYWAVQWLIRVTKFGISVVKLAAFLGL